MLSLRSAVLCYLLAALHPMLALGVDTLRPEQLKPGMRGYGLSVFKGTQPEKFDVEILGVLRNAFPKQDMILIRLSGADLERHKIIAGMSGSPIYIEGKLIGALAYGWGFENEPIAGVTPIKNMLAELNVPAPRKPMVSGNAGDRRWLQPPGIATVSGVSEQERFSAPHPLLTPLSIGGISPRMVEVVSQAFQRYGLLPTATGGSSSPELRKPRPSIEPGSGLGVE